VRSSRKSWLIEHQCPQCGGPITLGESDRLFTCEYCRVRLYFLGGNFFRYYIPPADGIEEDIYYVPYWRFRGMYYSCPPFELKSKVLDASFLASGHKFFPKTLGIRTQTLKLRFVSPEVKGKFFRTRLTFNEVLPKVEEVSGLHDSLADIRRAFHRAFIGETLSIIYSPVYVSGGAVHDGVLKRPVARYTSLTEDTFAQSVDHHSNWKVRFLSALCPNCGWDLRGGSESIILLCTRCDSAWKVSRGALRRQEFSVVYSREENICYVPFWRFKARFDGFQLNSYADLIRFANLPKVARAEHESQELYHWLPAFKGYPRLFMRLSKILTVAQPRQQYEDCLPSTEGAGAAPVTLGAREAAGGLKIALAGTTVAKRKVFPMLPKAKVAVQQAHLVFLPFRISGVDLIEVNLNIRIPRNALPLCGKHEE
jgi:hypothetical protein